MPETSYIEAIRTAMLEEMERDERVFLMGEDVGAYGGAFKTSAGLIDRFGPERVIDTPISEIAIVGAASGAALMGMRPIAEMQFIDFITCARYALRKPRTSITFEYTMMKGVNDQPEHARQLVKLMRKLDAEAQRADTGKLNLIPFNPFPGTRF